MEQFEIIYLRKKVFQTVRTRLIATNGKSQSRQMNNCTKMANKNDHIDEMKDDDDEVRKIIMKNPNNDYLLIKSSYDDLSATHNVINGDHDFDF